MYASYIIGGTASGCEFEAVALADMRNSPNWVSGDIIFKEALEKDSVKRKAHQQKMSKTFRKTAALPGELLANQVWDIKSHGRSADFALRTKKIRYEPRTFYSTMYSIYNAKQAMAFYQEVYLNPVDDAMFEGVFDPMVRTSSDPATLQIGIKYGVEHATRLTELLKDRGFELEKTTWIVCMPLKHIREIR